MSMASKRWRRAARTILVLAAMLGLRPPSPRADESPRAALLAELSTADDDAHATFDPDGGRVFFLKGSPNFAHWTVVVAAREGERWGEPEVAWFSGRYSDADMSFAPDARSIYFVSTRPARSGEPEQDDTDIWRMRRTAGGWSAPGRVAELASPGNEWFPNLTADGWLYFGSERRDGNLGGAGTSDLWRAHLVGDRFTAPENLGPRLNTAGNDIEPWVSADGRLMILASRGRPDTRGAYDLYISRRCGDEWSAARNLGDRVNSKGWDFGARPTPDGKWLVFTSNRAFTDQPLARSLGYRELLDLLHAPGNGLNDLYRIPWSALDLGPPCAASAGAPAH